MLPERAVHAHISLKEGPYVQPPNTVLVPNRPSFRITVQWQLEAKTTYVIAAPDAAVSRVWCLLDEKLRQVQNGADGKASASKKTDPNVARTVQGGGAPNPKEMAVELASAKLKNGHTYTLVCKRYGVVAAADFVAIKMPAAKKTAKKAAPKKTAKKAAAKQAPAKQAPAKKAAKKPAKKKKAAKRKAKKAA